MTARHAQRVCAVNCRETAAAADARRLVLGLYLIHLLARNSLAEFHSEVELLSRVDAATPAIAFPIQLESYLMEGSYNKVRVIHHAEVGGTGAYSCSRGALTQCSLSPAARRRSYLPWMWALAAASACTWVCG